MEKAERNFLLDEIKAVACIFVVLIHCKFPGRTGDICEALARFGVPMFFAVAGKYLISAETIEVKDIRSSMLRKIKKLSGTTAKVLAFYTIYSLWYCTNSGYSFSDWVHEKYNAFEFSRLILFNSGKFIYDFSYAFDHIWFMLALLYVNILVYIFAFWVRKWAGPLTVILLMFLFTGELLQTYYPIRPFDISISTWYMVRNWLFTGIPFTMLGFWFEEKGKKILQIKSTPVCALIIVFGIIMTAVEYNIFGSKEVYLGSLVIVSGCLYLAENFKLQDENVLSFAGRNLSSEIYYMHVFVISFFGWIIDHTNPELYGNAFFMYMRPVIVIAVTICISLLMYLVRCNKMIRKAV